ncbi:hypothetical protein [Burkholderia gladioli]|uniref:hypothetical protein n=1 Tax=Burkholderia gladioli TaxID=28095 RepID=UPI001640E346|nr:hypothetical protein [Burkholderia gladioli]
MTTTNESSKPADGGPAFPRAIQRWNDSFENVEGMTLRAYAAIKLRVPNSGIGWLDQMIVTSMRDEFAANAMQGLLCANSVYSTGSYSDELSARAYQIADAMLKARG